MPVNLSAVRVILGELHLIDGVGRLENLAPLR